MSDLRPLRVIVALCNRPKLLDVIGPFQVFSDARRFAPRGYDPVLTSVSGGPVSTDTSVSLDTRPLAEIRLDPTDTVVVPGGTGVFDLEGNAALVDWIRQAAPRVRTIASTCTGAFILAEAGVLEGRRAVTHWDDCADLRRRYPGVTVEEDPIFVVDGPVWTSAGVTAGIDLALAMVERDFGRPTAMKLARNLVMYAKRPGGQSQFSAELRAQVQDAQSTFEALHTWVSSNLTADLRVEHLAKHMAMSPRTFHRTYVAATGVTPARMVRRLRVAAARRMLEGTAQPVKRVADVCGFGTEEQMRRSFQAELRLSPSAYRQKWS